MQPILYLALFGPLLIPLAKMPGFPPGDAWRVFVPGLLVQLGIFGGAFVGFAIISEWREGVIDRMMVTPAARARPDRGPGPARCRVADGAGRRADP